MLLEGVCAGVTGLQQIAAAHAAIRIFVIFTSRPQTTLAASLSFVKAASPHRAEPHLALQLKQ
jgi:hypothetical protein